MTDSHENLRIQLKLQKLEDELEGGKERCSEHSSSTKNLKTVIFDPDDGLFARTKGLDSRLSLVEKWKDAQSKIIWVVLSGFLGLIVSKIWGIFSAGS